MTTLFKFLITCATKETLKLLTSIVDTIKQVFLYKKAKYENEKLKEAKLLKEEYEKKVNTVVDTGTIEDLLDLRK